ncbi:MULTISPECIES: CDP-diacylglycerol--glycerol-3-phosphate 3-phosphatidyltransferase [unclassified Leifsonia]|uniref:CDP-diacylglycerol--glycerol-3-phosphate 3-phosphatidyltransferase n=1 Tax=unclassified Leifsonia TaxID=2663824 RepID=UPI0006FD4DBA|nr:MULTISPECIES: CDP-diacylglycerol--glycerol-3-phosphate 3-phosphatidyltransferase [unclassified Leifsonia]KQX06639.1 CDP-diacylglycerol--glycerol-3-phosphate 3-phosphatidyltransferase [Leifsonia sp. Root1293]KRA10923.1 CDP-diacylglycerol--glycerol-3-phosphate 3-phosphatidyltransferase [Leifsonia sp. Root60]
MASLDAEVPRASNWNLPNLITVVRILLAPLFFWMLLVDNGADGALRWWAAVVFIVAIATDGVDGAIARRQGLVTDLGKILDPIADKLLTGGALVCLSILGELWWWVTIIILVREVGITVWRMVELSHRNVVPASRGGKLKTIAQSIAISLALVPLWTVLGDWVFWVNWVAMGIAFALTVWSGVEYLVSAWKLKRALPAAASGSSSATDA